MAIGILEVWLISKISNLVYLLHCYVIRFKWEGSFYIIMKLARLLLAR